MSFATTPLPDGTTGYYTRRPDDCLPAAIATVLQTADVPDLRIDARLRAGIAPQDVDRVARQELIEWLAGRGLQARVHEHVPVSGDRCIGIVPIDGWFRNHCLVLHRGRLLHDPAARAVGIVHRLLGIRAWDAASCRRAMTFESLPTNRQEP